MVLCACSSPNPFLLDKMAPPVPGAEKSPRGSHPNYPEVRQLAKMVPLTGKQWCIASSSTWADVWVKMPILLIVLMGNTTLSPEIMNQIQDGIPRYLLTPSLCTLVVSSSACIIRPKPFTHPGRSQSLQPKTATTSSQTEQNGQLPSLLNSCDRCQAGNKAHWASMSGLDGQSVLDEPESAAGKEDRFMQGKQTTSRSGIFGKKDKRRPKEGGASRKPEISPSGFTKGSIARSPRRSFWRAALSFFGIRMVVQEPPSDKTSTQEFSSGDKAGSSKKRAGSRNLDGIGGRESSETHKVRKCRASVDEQGSKRRIRWACPFLRMNPRMHRSCNEFKMTKISHVVQHLKRKHLKQGERICPMCGLELATLPQFNEHVQTRTCSNQALDYMTSSQETQIKQVSESRRRGFSDERKWYACWEILFPNTPSPEPPRGPFLEHPLLEEHSRIWNEFGDVEDDPEVEAASPIGVDGATRRVLINAIRNAIGRRISAYVDDDLERGTVSTFAPTQEPTPTTQPRPLVPVVPQSQSRNRPESRPSRVLPPQQRAVSSFVMLPFAEENPASEAAYLWHGAMGADGGSTLGVGHFHEAPIQFDEGLEQPWNTTESTNLPASTSQPWMDPSFLGNGLNVQVQEFGLDDHRDSLVYSWQDDVGFPFAPGPQLISPQAGQNRQSVVANASDLDEYLEPANVGDDDLMPDGLSQWLSRYEGPSDGVSRRPGRC